MMEKNKQYIEELIERFFDGTTSNIEEQELYLFFTSKEVPEELEKYKSLFQYFDTELIEDLRIIEQRQEDVKISQPRKEKSKKLIVTLTAVAASLLLLFIIYPFTSKDTLNPYEGSYVRINGQIYNDPKLLEKKEKEILEQLQEKEKTFDAVEANIKNKNGQYKDLQEEINHKTEKYEKLLQTTN